MGEVMYHINLKEGDVGEYCILVGDPGRCEKVASYFDESEFVTSNREFTTYRGKLDGVDVCVTSTGIGGPSAAIAIEELTKVGVKYFIRVGTCGGINLDVKSGDLVVATSAIRQEGTSKEYAPVEYPASADMDIVFAIKKAVDKMDVNAHFGVVQSKDSFYGQHSPEKSPVSYDLLNKWESWKKLGVLSSEMETAALYTVAASIGVKCGCILAVIWNQERKAKGLIEEDNLDTGNAIYCAINAIKVLIEENK